MQCIIFFSCDFHSYLFFLSAVSVVFKWHAYLSTSFSVARVAGLEQDTTSN